MAATTVPMKPATPAPRAAPEPPGLGVAVVVGVTAALPQTLSSTLLIEATRVGWQTKGTQMLISSRSSTQSQFEISKLLTLATGVGVQAAEIDEAMGPTQDANAVAVEALRSMEQGAAKRSML